MTTRQAPKRKAGQSSATDVPAPRGSDRDHIQSLERGLAVIRYLGTTQRAPLSQVAKQTGMTRAAARRFLITLERLGYVAHSGFDFYLCPRTLELGYGYLSSQSLPQIVQPHLEALAQDLQETCSVTVFDRQQLLYVARVTTNRLVGSTLSVGSTLPAYCTAAGRVLLSALSKEGLADYLQSVDLERFTPKTIVSRTLLLKEIDRARQQGWYLSDEEIDKGVRSLALPLHDSNQQVIAALNVSCYVGRVVMDTITQKFLPRMRKAAGEIDLQLKASQHTVEHGTSYRQNR